MYKSVNTRRPALAITPLAAALALSLTAATATAQTAPPPDGTSFATRLQNFEQVVAQLRQSYAQHPLFATSAARPQARHTPMTIAATITVTSCTDTATSATTPGTLRYAVLNAAANDAIDLGACNNSTITLTQGALPVAVNALAINAGAAAGNHVVIDGGGSDRVFFDTGTGYLALYDLTIQNGKFAPASGNAAGGCINSAGGVSLLGSTVSGCTAVSASGAAVGGGIYAHGLYMAASTLSGNKVTSTGTPAAAVGGGAFIIGEAYLHQQNVVSGNAAVAGNIAMGGGVYAKYSIVLGSTVSGNSARVTQGGTGSNPYVAFAGGLEAKYLHLGESTISGNQAICASSGKSYCLGGGIVAGKSGATTTPLAIAYSTIDNNQGGFAGGGVVSKYAATISQSTISGNTAEGGAGLILSGNSSNPVADSIYNSTIAMNMATYVGAGIATILPLPGSTPKAPSITMISSLVAQNTAPTAADIYAPTAAPVTITGSNNLVMSTVNVTLPTGTLSASPLLQALANNGGPTQTMGLSVGSPALNVGSNLKNYAADQRGAGFPRTTGGLTDIGAFQGTITPVAAVPAPALSVWALGLLAGLLGGLGWRHRRRIPLRE